MSDLNITEALEALKKGATEIIDEGALVEKLQQIKDRPLRIKLGFDPSSPDIHLGHTVILNKLREFQNLGHIAVFVIGDYTARIGDPSGRNKLRPPLSPEEINHNAKTYTDQAFKILDPDKVEVVYNHTWLSHLSSADIIGLCSKMSVAQMLERDDFSNRYRSKVPIFLHEFLYPLFQGYDSVILKCDVEIGGTDQKFNLLVGRHLQRAFDIPAQDILMMPLLVGLDGKHKMSKSYGNTVAVKDTPNDMFGKIMSISDTMMFQYYELLSFRSVTQLDQLKNELSNGLIHPMAAKIQLAKEITARFHSSKCAEEAQKHFETVHQQRDTPDDVPVISIEDTELPMGKLVHTLGLAPSMNESRRKIMQGAVSLNGEKVTDPSQLIEITQDPQLIRFGKRHFKKFVKQSS